MVAIVVPFMAVVIMSQRDSMSQRREAQIENSVIVAHSVAGVVDGFVRDLESFGLAAAIALGAQQRPLDDAITASFLEQLHSSYGLVRSIFITDLQGRVIASRDSQGLGRDVSGRSYITNLQAGAESTWSEAVAGQDTGLTTVAHSRIIRGLDEEPRGYLVIAFYPESLTERLPDDLPQNANVTFIDTSGALLFASHPQSQVPPRERIPEFGPIESALGGTVGKIRDQSTPFHPETRFGAYVPVPSNGWVVGYTLPQGPLESSLQNRFYRDIALTSFVLLVGLGVMLFMADRISQPLTSLAGAAAAIARGERPVVPTAAAPQEVMQLEQAMDVMSRAVVAREEQLTEQARVLSALERVAASVASELDYQRAAQTVTDAATDLTGAEYGAFFFKDSREGEAPFTAAGADPGRIASMALLQWVSASGKDGDSRIVLIDDVEKRQSSRNGKGSGVRSFLSVPVQSRSGEPLGVLVFGHTMPDRFGEVHTQLATGLARWAAIAMDNARLFREAQEAQEQLRLSNRAKDEFLGIISHELRTPITTIFGTARLLEARKGRLDPEVHAELMANLTSEAERMHRLVEDLLAVARTELGKETITEPVLLGPLIDNVAEIFTAMRPDRRLQVRVQDGLPPAMGDLTYLEQVLMNLLTNSAKYADGGEPIELEARSEAEQVLVSVADRGPGVATEELPLIFESFYRSDSTANQASGKGLGLTVCKRLVEAQGGRIWAEGRPEGGLKICFALQTAKVAEEVEAVN